MYAQNLGNAITQLAVQPNAAIASTSVSAAFDLTGTPTASTAVNTGSLNYEGSMAFLLDALNTAGTAPTLAIKLTHCATSGGSYTDVPNGGFTSLSGASQSSQQKVVVNKDDLLRFVKVSYTIGGSATPSYNVSIQGVVASKYPA